VTVLNDVTDGTEHQQRLEDTNERLGGFLVADDGPGVPADRRDEVFDPGVTTARDGTGFGLAIVGRIAEGHDWTVELRPDTTETNVAFDGGPPSESFDGACFAFYADD
jgi:nitrogen-specific signal transduction histidine kinase